MGASNLNPRGRLMTTKKSASDFPTQQFVVLALCRLCEPIAFMSVFPYIYFMIGSFEIAADDGQIAIYAGMVTTAFAFSEFLTGVLWGNLSDRVGRKPCLIGGLLGTAISMIIFGFSRNFTLALIARSLGGLLNGNIGVLQTTVAELITKKEDQPFAYSIMPFVWCLGSIIGPALGGWLAQPCLSYPSWFSRGTMFDKFPFLLPNLVCVVILLIGVTIGILFLEETHVEIKHTRRDYGLEAGAWILKHFQKSSEHVLIADKHEILGTEEVEFLLDSESPPGYRTTEGSPRMPSSRASSPAKKEAQRILRSTLTVWTKQVLVQIAGYGLLACHSISFDQLMPIFLSSDVSTTAPSLPFKFLGGFALSTKTIGILLAIQGIYSMAAQLYLFPFVVKRVGNLNTFRFVIMAWPLLYFLVPYLVFLPSSLQMCGVLTCLFLKITAQVLAFPSNNIMLQNSAPSLLVLGRINGAAGSTASLARAFGPSITGLIHSKGLEMGYSGLAWWAGGIVCTVGFIESLWMEEGDGRLDTAQDDIDEEDAMHEAYIDPLAIDAAISAVVHPERIEGSDSEQ